MKASTRTLVLGSLLLAFGPLSAKTPGKMPPLPPAPTPNPLVRYEFAAGELNKLCDAGIAKAKERLDAIGALKPEDRNPDNTLLAMENALADYNSDVTELIFMSYVSTNEAVTKEAQECRDRSEAFDVEISSRRDLYNSIVGLKARTKAEARLLQKTLEGFEDSGMKLNDADLAKYVDLNKELNKKQSEYSNTLNQDSSKIEFSAEELAGLPEDYFLGREKTSSGKYVLTAKTPDYAPVLQYAKSPETRKKMQIFVLNVGGSGNIDLLEEAAGLRQKIASLMSFDTWADYRVARKMAKDKKTILDFLNGLRSKLAIKNKSDLDSLLAVKKEEYPDAKVLDPWDVSYYTEIKRKRDFNLDKEKIKEYFPSEIVVKGIFSVYSKILGVKFQEEVGAKTWSPDVKLYGIYDKSSGRKVAYFYADLYPRKGKYNHAAAFTLEKGRRLPSGAYSMPVSAIVANLNPPKGDKPSLLSHDEVETFFHEFGHIMHQTLTRAPYGSLSGTSVAGDFVEAPSQMLENWVWTPVVLDLVSGHYKDHSKKLPREYLDALLKGKDFMQGNFYTKQLLYGLFDMTIHTSKTDVDPVTLYNNLYRDIVGLEPASSWKFPASFGHLMGGYDAGYYGYLWSEVYAQDMFTLFEPNVLSEKVGMRYRKVILENGNMYDAIDLLRKFLGREPNNKAFFKKIGVN